MLDEWLLYEVSSCTIVKGENPSLWLFSGNQKIGGRMFLLTN